MLFEKWLLELVLMIGGGFSPLRSNPHLASVINAAMSPPSFHHLHFNNHEEHGKHLQNYFSNVSPIKEELEELSKLGKLA
jgi:hypothetical protein